MTSYAKLSGCGLTGSSSARSAGGRGVVSRVARGGGIRDGEPLVTEVFAFAPRLGAAGTFACGGVEPELARTLRSRGVRVPEVWFVPGPDLAAPVEGAVGER